MKVYIVHNLHSPFLSYINSMENMSQLIMSRISAIISITSRVWYSTQLQSMVGLFQNLTEIPFCQYALHGMWWRVSWSADIIVEANFTKIVVIADQALESFFLKVACQAVITAHTCYQTVMETSWKKELGMYWKKGNNARNCINQVLQKRLQVLLYLYDNAAP